jgi:hypothetical protein
MAKELPYFQFEPAEYLTKDISFCSLSAQGLFINICSYYWQRQCDLSKEQFLRRFNYESEFNELVKEGVIDIQEEKIVVKFLNIQYQKATEFSQEQSRKGSLGGRPKKPNESQMKAEINPNESQTKAIREDKIKENEIVNNTIVHSFLHLSINQEELDKLKEKFSEEDIFDCFDKIENYKDNKKYKSLYLTANTWLKKDYKEKSKEDDLPYDKKIDWKVFLDWFNDVINPDFKLKEVPQQTKNRYLNLLQSGFTKDHLITAILNGKKDNENLFNITIDTFSNSNMVSKYQKDVTKIGML